MNHTYSLKVMETTAAPFRTRIRLCHATQMQSSFCLSVRNISILQHKIMFPKILIISCALGDLRKELYLFPLFPRRLHDICRNLLLAINHKVFKKNLWDLKFPHFLLPKKKKNSHQKLSNVPVDLVYIQAGLFSNNNRKSQWIKTSSPWH